MLRRKLHSLRLKEGESVQRHIRQMTELFNELAAIGGNLDEEDRVVHLLASLPESYDTLVTLVREFYRWKLSSIVYCTRKRSQKIV